MVCRARRKYKDTKKNKKNITFTEKQENIKNKKQRKYEYKKKHIR